MQIIVYNLLKTKNGYERRCTKLLHQSNGLQKVILGNMTSDSSDELLTNVNDSATAVVRCRGKSFFHQSSNQ